jgi:hypothetical protein
MASRQMAIWPVYLLNQAINIIIALQVLALATILLKMG